jgi:hypothetical protein
VSAGLESASEFGPTGRDEVEADGGISNVILGGASLGSGGGGGTNDNESQPSVANAPSKLRTALRRTGIRRRCRHTSNTGLAPELQEKYSDVNCYGISLTSAVPVGKVHDLAAKADP